MVWLVQYIRKESEEMKKHKLHSTVVNQCLCCSVCSILQCLQHQVASALKMDDTSQTQLQSPAALQKNERKLQLVDTMQLDSAICYQIVKYFRWRWPPIFQCGWLHVDSSEYWAIDHTLLCSFLDLPFWAEVLPSTINDSWSALGKLIPHCWLQIVFTD